MRTIRIVVVLLVVGALLGRTERVRKPLDRVVRAFRDGVETVTGKKPKELAEQARKDLERGKLRRALRSYVSKHGDGPEVLEDLVKDGLLDRADLVDEWGRSLQVEVNAEGVFLRSAGRDGRFHTRDDWVLGDG